MSTYYDINESLFDQIMEAMLDQLPADMDKREGGIAYTLLAPKALELEKLYQDLDALEQTSFLIDENGNTSAYGSYIDRRVNEFGVFRKAGGNASAIVTLTADPQVTVPAFTQLMASDGSAQVFETQVDVIATPSGTQTGVTSLEASSAANVPAGAIDTVLGDLAAVVTVTAATSADGGFDEEDDDTLVRRFLNYQERQQTSGNIGHYQRWATEVSGIERARVTPLAFGPGTVKVTLIASDGGAPTVEKRQEVADYIETQRPIGAGVTVVGATEVPVDVVADVTYEDGADVAAVIKQYKADLAAYLLPLDPGEAVTATRVGGLLVAIPEVLDYANLTINGGTASIVLGDDEVAVVGAVLEVVEGGV